ncbi:DUF6891 domain-containing protein [Propionibacteriaceae bacterium G1746]
MSELSPQAQAFLDNSDVDWVIDEVRQRIMTGDLDDLDVTADLLLEGAEQEDASLDDETAEELTTHLWAESLDTAEEWADRTTDVDRVMAAFESLVEQDISVGVFVDWPEMELQDDDRGGVVIWVNEWERMSWTETTEIAIHFAGVTSSDAEIGQALFDALTAAGLKPGAPQDGSLALPVLWQWHVSDPDDEDFDDEEEFDDADPDNDDLANKDQPDLR